VRYITRSTLLLLVLIAAATAEARDRPGSPNKLSVEACGISPPVSTRPSGPAICVQFSNTADEEVRFEYEFTANGVPVPKPDWTKPNIPREGYSWVDCIGRDGLTNEKRRPRILPYGCVGADDFNGYDSTALGRTNIDKERDGVIARPQFMRIRNLDFETQYCIRVRSRTADSEVVSAIWSNWGCLTTEMTPTKPGMPPGFAIEYTPGGEDWRTDPPRIHLKWERAANYVVAYGVEEGTWRQGFKADDYMKHRFYVLPDGRAVPTYVDEAVHGDALLQLDYQGEMSINEVRTGAHLEYRICAESEYGKTCTPTLAAQPLSATNVAATNAPPLAGAVPNAPSRARAAAKEPKPSAAARSFKLLPVIVPPAANKPAATRRVIPSKPEGVKP
jgi:interferon-alpha/beta receptor-like fibronectin type III protein